MLVTIQRVCREWKEGNEFYLRNKLRISLIQRRFCAGGRVLRVARTVCLKHATA